MIRELFHRSKREHALNAEQEQLKTRQDEIANRIEAIRSEARTMRRMREQGQN